MACAAELRGKLGVIRYRHRHVRIMASLAVSNDHLRQVGLVALRTLRDLAVDIMTGGAAERTMLRLVAPHQLCLDPVTVKTFIFDLEPYIQGGMGILVAVEAAGHFEMRLPCLQMTLVAVRNRFLDFGRMTHVAADAGHAPVLSSCLGYVIHRPGVALQAIFFF